MPTEQDHIGRPSRASATAALKAHVAVQKGKPLRAAISEALAREENLGGKERRFVAHTVRELSRHLRWIELLGREAGQAPSQLQLEEDRALVRYVLWRRWRGGDRKLVEREISLPGPLRPRSIPDAALMKLFDAEPKEPSLPADPLEAAATRESFPKWLAEAISRSAPEGEGPSVLTALNREPGVTLRVRPPGTREEILKQGHSIAAIADAPDAVRLEGEGRAIFDSPAMKTGRLQVMDLGSQQIVALCRAQPGMTVVDWCAGAGGKTLYLADLVGKGGKVIATDLKRSRLDEARKRARAWGLKNVSYPEEVRLEDADVVLVDAPCSGSGTLGREPDQKWKLSQKKIDELTQTQSEILERVAPKLKPGAALVYGTCSVLREENEAIVEAFLKKHPGFELDGPMMRVWPHRETSGGFFGARLTVKR